MRAGLIGADCGRVKWVLARFNWGGSELEGQEKRALDGKKGVMDWVSAKSVDGGMKVVENRRFEIPFQISWGFEAMRCSKRRLVSTRGGTAVLL